ncbi:unnamed protein product [Nezara viridula]|uniref:Protein kinase domain-containing protein n=1 Tax=Nezara viridula TaxID=85310 RepID=A0A9P0MP12_NEZVI|nr:unnamed protein product [Nezara viridula]
MFRNYLANTKEDDNGTENWSYPAGYERFNSANIPRGRLGKRRTINPSTEIKRSTLNGVSSENRSDRGDLKNFGSKTSCLTHPVNSFLTPNYKKIDNGLERNCDGSIENRPLDFNVGNSNSYRIPGSYPLQEVNNIINDNKILGIDKLSNISGPLHQDPQQSDVKVTQNNSYEDEKGQRIAHNFSSEECTQHYTLSSNNGTVFSDSSQSELCNNSSFMTAHDYNFEKNQSYHHDYMKTPGKGYGLFDMVTSPLVSLSGNTDDDNDSLRKFLVKTPAIGRYDPLNTPYRSQIKHDLFTPFKSKIHTPRNDKQLDSVSEKNVEFERSEDSSQEFVSRLEDSLRTDCSINSGKKLCCSDNNDKIETSALIVGMNSTPLPIANDFKRKNISELNKQPPSVEKLVKRQIFEGLGWTLPHSSFAIQSPIKETPSTVVKKNIDPKNDLLPIIGPEFQPMFDILNQPLCLNKVSTDSLLQSKSFDHKTENQSQDSKSISSIDNKVTYSSEGSLAQEDVTMRSPIIEEPINLPIHNNVNNTCKLNDCSDEPDSSTPRLKHSSTTDNTMKSSSNNVLLNENECTVVMHPKDERKNEKMESNETIILKQSSPPKVPDKKSTIEGLNNRKPDTKTKPECFIENPIFACQRQIMRSPQANITVNEKPYTVLSMLGRGGSSEVYLVLDPNSSKLMALKVVNLSSVEDAVAKGYLNEIEVLSKLQGCPSVIKMFDHEYISESKILYVLMEKGDTDFSRLMKDITKTKKISMSMITYYWTEMLNAVKDIHDKGIIHSDLKPANFLLVSGRLKLIDFGIASSLQGDMTSVLKDVTTGTFNYMSPEAIRNSGETRGYKINYKSDIWSLGCILYNLLYGRTPFSHLTNTWTKLQAIADPESAVSFPSGSAAPPHLLLSVRWALTKDPKDRPTAEELLRLAEFTPGPETQLGRQISALLGEYLLQMFPNCRVRLENPKDKKQQNSLQ